jgi:hypothetical protein
MGVLLEKPTRPTRLIEVLTAVPASTDLRLAEIVHGAASPKVEEDAFACARFERQEVPQHAGQCLGVLGALLVGEKDADDELPIVAAAGARLRTVNAVGTSHGLSLL